MLKLKFLLWILGVLLKRTWRKDEGFRKKLVDQPLTFAIKITDSKLERSFLLQATGVTTQKKTNTEPNMTLVFGTAAQAWNTLTSKNKNTFMQAIQDGNVKIEGDYKRLFQLQSLIKHLKI